MDWGGPIQVSLENFAACVPVHPYCPNVRQIYSKAFFDHLFTFFTDLGNNGDTYPLVSNHFLSADFGKGERKRETPFP